MIRPAGSANILNRVNELSATTFQNVLSRPEAIIQGVRASTLRANRAGNALFENLARALLLEEPSIPNALRAQNRNPDADRFNMETARSQLRRTFLSDINGAVRITKVEQIDTPRFGAAAVDKR